MLGNLALLSYFAKKREKEAMVIQTLGVVTTYIVFAQLAIAGAMPVPHFAATSAVVASGLVINFMNYFNILPIQILKFWEDFITVGGFSVLPQVISLLVQLHSRHDKICLKQWNFGFSKFSCRLCGLLLFLSYQIVSCLE